MKIGVILLVLLLCVPVTTLAGLPFSEAVEINSADDQYDFNVVVPVHVLKGSTYELENRNVHIEIGPQDWAQSAEGGSQDYKGYFLKILVSIVITDMRGKISEDFISYLNCELENCDTASRTGRLFWDHAGEERADHAGESFSGDEPLTVSDKYVEVTVQLIGLRLARYWDCNTSTGSCESDASCLIHLDNLILKVEVTYSASQLEYKSLSEKASEYVERGDAFFQEGDLDEARSHYEKAKALYDQVNDEVQSNHMKEKILQIDYLKASLHVDEAEKYFSEEEYEKAREEYEKAKIIYNQLSDTEQSVEIQERIVLCMSYASAVEMLEEAIRLFEEAQTKYGQRLDAFEEARSYFEKAKQEFDVLGDSQKSSECTTWMNRCDEEMSKLITVKVAEVEPFRLSLYGKLMVIAMIAGVVVVTLVLRWSLAEKERKVLEAPEDPELKQLRRSLATGKTTPEEYEKLLSNLENMRKLKYRLATGEITIDEYETLKSQLDS